MATTSDPKVIVRELDSFTGEQVRKIILDVVDLLLDATPVDTGWARANWIPSIGQPLGGPAGSPEDTGSADLARNAGTASMLGYSIDKGPAFITNSVPYIARLDQGSSQQAPAGFVEIAIDTALLKNEPNRGE